MPRNSSKTKAGYGPVPQSHPKAAAAAPPNPSLAHLAHDYPAEVPGAVADGAVDVLQRLDLDVSAASAEDAPVETSPEAPAPPMEASSSGSAVVGGGQEEEGLRRLQELVRIGREKVELTQEEVRANDQSQVDEICALEAIFADSVVIFSKKEGQRSFQVHVHIEIPDGIDVSARLSFGAGTLNYKEAHEGDASDDLFYKFRVEHLPPILLTCLMPPSYDLGRATWRGSNIPVGAMAPELFPYLGFGSEIVLSKGDQTCIEDGGDKRACPDNAPPDVTIPRIIRYNDDKRHEAFLHAIHYCMICFSEFPGVDFIKLPCHHFFCQKCMQTYCKMHVKEGTVVKLLCPDTKCGAVIPPNILQRLLGEDEFERWEALLLQKTLDAMVDVVYCPRCHTACLEDAETPKVCENKGRYSEAYR
uniref:Uncharacterized protein n=2 Tax=Avena sativa TaxID=4498 RepID=A0ACD5VIY5_AVESA